MANALYPKGKKQILDGNIDLLVDDIKVALIDVADETYNAADEFLSDITGAGIVATSGNLAGKTTTSGVFDANDATLTSVTGDPAEAMILYKDTGSAATSPLIAWFDISTYTPTGVNADVIFHSSGLFAI
jgi:hypothetical protein